MRPLHCNLVSHVIVIPILTTLASICTSTTAGGRVGGKGEKDQEQEQGGDGGTESESESGSLLISSSGSNSEGSSYDYPSKSSSSSLSCPTMRREGGRSDSGFREDGRVARRETRGRTQQVGVHKVIGFFIQNPHLQHRMVMNRRGWGGDILQRQRDQQRIHLSKGGGQRRDRQRWGHSHGIGLVRCRERSGHMVLHVRPYWGAAYWRWRR